MKSLVDGLAGGIRRHPWFSVWLALLPVALLRAGRLAESDTFWQIRTGLFILEHAALPTADPFSWTARGEPWTLNSWAFDVLLAAAYRMAGLSAVALVGAAFVACISALVLLVARSVGASPLVSGAAFLFASPLLIAWFSVRPQLVDYAGMLLLVLLLQRLIAVPVPGKQYPHAGTLGGVAVLLVIWVNLHAAVLLGIAVIGLMCALLVVRWVDWNRGTRSLPARGRLCAAALVTGLAASLLNPYGAGLFSQTMGVKGVSSGVVTEWDALSLADPQQALMFTAGLAGFGVALRRRDPVHTAALAVTLAGSVVAIRILPILLLLALPLLAAALSHRALREALLRRRVILAPAAVAGLFTVTVMAAAGAAHLGQPDPRRYPGAIMDRIPSGCRLFTSYIIGGYVLLQRPDVPVSIDSRNDLYGVDTVVRAELVLRGEADGERGLAGADCALVPPDAGIVDYLRDSGDWALEGSDAAAVLYIRR